MTLEEKQLLVAIAEALHAVLEGWIDEEKENVPQSIRNATENLSRTIAEVLF